MTIALIALSTSTLFFLFLYRMALKRRINLVSYIILLLLDERVSVDHRAKLKSFIKQCDASDAMELSQRSHRAIERMADDLSGTSPLGAHAAVWHEHESVSA